MDFWVHIAEKSRKVDQIWGTIFHSFAQTGLGKDGLIFKVCAYILDFQTTVENLI